MLSALRQLEAPRGKDRTLGAEPRGTVTLGSKGRGIMAGWRKEGNLLRGNGLKSSGGRYLEGVGEARSREAAFS